MNKLPCEVIQDLIPLYVDGVCSAKSKLYIEEHLKSCETCHNYLAEMKGEIPMLSNVMKTDNLYENEIRFFKGLRKTKIGQVVIGALLGSVPGCMGGFATVSLYTHRMFRLKIF